jgi:pSer/pThr/pTyr-binding forkhead associated (FHA) protein
MQHRRIAPVHVAVVNDGTQIMAVDLVTSYGTLLNGLKMEHERLNDGDLLTCRPWEFRAVVQRAEHTERDGRRDAHPFGLDPSPHVVALEHVNSGRILRPNREICIIGRRNGCDITITDSQVSRVHALLLNYFGHPAVFDLLSTNQTLVNGDPVQYQRLRNDDILTVGESPFRVRLLDSKVTEQAAGFKVSTDTTIELKPEQRPADMIDIKATESAQKWRIADKLENTAHKPPKRTTRQ